jgi:amino-acid N-acetyltransferase
MTRIERAVASDTPAVLGLLADAGLPLDGAAEALAMGIVAREDEVVVGGAAVERYGEAGLLRSVVVAPVWRGGGLGRELVTAAEVLARGVGIHELYLLTETAQGWFAALGYDVVSREDARIAVGESVEFTMSCATTGVPMRRALANTTRRG